jgi:tRNA threonylcarbamoyl adenosine modification protein YeaZ
MTNEANNTTSEGPPLILAIETSGRLGSVAVAQGPQLLAEKQFSGPMRHSAEVFPAIVDLLGRSDKKPADVEQVYISAGPGSFTGLRIAVTIAKTMALAGQCKIVAVDTLDCIAANVIDNCRAGLAPPIPPFNRLAAILDAKRGQFFIAVYEQSAQHDLPAPARLPSHVSSGVCRQGSFPRKRESSVECLSNTESWPLRKILPDCLMTAEEFLERFANNEKPIALIGEGLVFYKDKFSHNNVRVLDEKYWNPSAANVHRLGWQLACSNRFADPLMLTPNYIRGPDVKVKQL